MQSGKQVSQFADLVTQRELPPESTEGPPAIQARDFSVFYGDFEAVRSVTMDFPRKAVTAIIGPSGCGKSTLLNAINRMTDLIPGAHTKGKVLFHDEDIYGPDMDVVALRRRMGMVFQKPNPFPTSIYHNVTYAPKLHGIRGKERLDELVERSLREAGLWDEVKDRLKSSALGLSGGQQQRLCIARAIAIEPELILLDEPTSALDPQSTARIEDLLDSLRGHYSIAIVTHNMQQAARVSDYTAFMYKGDLIEFDETPQLFMKPSKEETLRYITGRFG
jgi:phosphate transport system ATP-binding protein